MSSLLHSVWKMDPFLVGMMTATQFAFGVAWFNVIVHHFETYYLAADKGVRRVEHAVHRYSPPVVHAVALLCCVLRSLVVLMLVHASHSTTLLDYQYVGLIATGISLMTSSRHFAWQRPIQLFVSQWGFELGASMIAAIIAFYAATGKR